MNDKLQGTSYLPEVDINNKEYIKESLIHIYEALSEKGYNPVMQIVGYLMSEDPTYITAHKNARILASKLDRFEVLDVLVENFINTNDIGK